jgi:hypothetical protein
MKAIKCIFRISAVLLALSAVFVSCEKKTPGSDPSQAQPAPSGGARYTADGRRIITIGTWYDRYYVSKHTNIHDNPNVVVEETAVKRLEKIREIEAKYNIVLNYVNLTFEGIQESINVSIPSGVPDVDIYEADLQFGIPAVLRNYAVSLEEMDLGETDIFTSQSVMKYLRLTGQNESFLFAPSRSGGIDAYVLAFNMDMIRKAGLPNPQDVYDSGEWTWNRWREYLLALTQDTTGDGNINIYGYSGYWTNLLTNLLLSNDTGIAQGLKETLSSPKTLETLKFIDDLYHRDKTARPWDRSNWGINNRLYAEGLSGFWIGADWIFYEQGYKLPFEVGVVPWPRGPQGSFRDNRHSLPMGNWYFIPKGTENPRQIYDVIFDWTNWYNYDLALGVDDEWSRTVYMTERNYDYAVMMAGKPGFDLWENLGTGFSLLNMLVGEVTPEEIVDSYYQRFQDALDNYFK